MAERAGLRLAGLVVDGAAPVEVSVGPGQLALVEGPSLTVVSALLACCAGLRRPVGGDVLLDGVPLPARPSPRLAYSGRTETVLGTLTPVENLMLAALASGRRSTPAVVQEAEQQLAALDLGPATWHNLVEQLSGGQQQRVALARAFFAAPDVLLLDHPTSDLDPVNVELVAGLLDAARARGGSVLLATDDPLLTAAADLTVALTTPIPAPASTR